jgi:hypothetical protein
MSRSLRCRLNDVRMSMRGPLPGPLILVAALAIASLAPPAQASHFEFCEIEGRIDAIAHAVDVTSVDAKSSGPMLYTITVLDARESRSQVGSYIDCRDYIGQPMDLEMALPRRAGQAAVGDILRVRRSVVEGMDHNGGMITSVNVVFRKLRRAPR